MKQFLFHVLFWVLILLWRANGDYYCKAPLEYFILHNLIRLPVAIGLTYFVIYYLLPKYIIVQKDYLKFALCFAVSFWFSLVLEEKIINADLMSWFLPDNDTTRLKVFSILHPYRNSFALLSIIALASLPSFIKLYLQQEKQRHELQAENLNTKLAFLKAQVNPHFLFNALNNVYSMAVQKDQTEIAESLENLSGIMHYLTYESSSDLVPLQKEIQLLQNYIEIQQLRIASIDDTTISFLLEGEVLQQKMAPVLLLPIVENAFKHGIKPDQKCLISIKLYVTEQSLIFKTTNTLFAKSEQEIKEKGIGLENVLKRLAMIYPGRHHFTTKASNQTFFTELQIHFDALPHPVL